MGIKFWDPDGTPEFIQSQDLTEDIGGIGHWDSINAITVTSGQLDPFGGSGAYLLTDAASGSTGYKSYIIEGFADTTVRLSFVIAKNSFPTSGGAYRIALYEIGSGYVGQVDITSWASEPVLDVVAGTLISSEPYGAYGGYYKITFDCPIQSGESYQVRYLPAGKTVPSQGSMFAYEVSLTATGYVYGAGWHDEESQTVFDPSVDDYVQYILAWAWDPMTQEWEVIIRQPSDKSWGHSAVLNKVTVYLDQESLSEVKALALTDSWSVFKEVRDPIGRLWADTIVLLKSAEYQDEQSYSREKTLTILELFEAQKVSRESQQPLGDSIAIVKSTAYLDVESYSRSKSISLVDAFDQGTIGPVGVPTMIGASNESYCSGSTPTYAVAVTWLNGDPLSETEIIRVLPGPILVVDTVAPGVTEYEHNPSPGTLPYSWKYGVRHIRNGIRSAHSVDDTFTSVDEVSCGPTGAPTDLQLQDVSYCVYGSPSPVYSTRVTWSNTDPTSYTRIYDGPTLVHTAGPGISVWDDPDSGNYGLVEYTIKHYKNGIESDGVTEYITLDQIYCSPIGAPTGLVVIDSSYCDSGDPSPKYEAGLSWTNVDETAQTRIYRNGSLIHTVGAGVSEWVNTGESPGGPRNYQVKHFRNGIESAASSDSVTIAAISCAPTGAPTSVVAVDSSYCSIGNPSPQYEAAITWSNFDSTSQTRIYRQGVLVYTAPAGADEWANSGESVGGPWTYELRHFKNGIESAGASDSVTISAISCAPSGPPNSITAQDYSECSSCVGTLKVRVQVSISDATAQTRIYRSPGGLVHTLAAGDSIWEYDTSVSEGEYTYEARHVKNGVESTGVTDPVVVADPCSTPSAPALVASPISKSSIQIGISGAAPAGVESITVYRLGTSTVVGTLSALNSWSVSDSGRLPDTEYCYDGEAHSEGGCTSARGGDVCATTLIEAPSLVSITTNYSTCPGYVSKDVTLSFMNSNGDPRNDPYKVYIDGVEKQTGSGGDTTFSIGVLPGDAYIEVAYIGESERLQIAVGISVCPS